VCYRAAVKSTDVTRWIRRVHLWLGLLACTALITFGAAGLASAWHQRPWRADAPTRVQRIAFAPEAGASDVEIAEAVRRRLALPFSVALSERALRRDGEGRLTFTFFTPNADHRVTWLAGEGAIEVAARPVALDDFLGRMHSMMFRTRAAGEDWRLRLWSLYVELSIWAVLLLPVTGLTLWLTSPARRRYRPARWILGGATLLALLFYVAIR